MSSVDRSTLFQPTRPSAVEHRVWGVMRRVPAFTPGYLAHESGRSMATVSRYLRQLIHVDYVEVAAGQLHFLRRNTGSIAPAMTENRLFLFDGNNGRYLPVAGGEAFPPEAPGYDSVIGRLWLACRIMRTFRAGDLVATTETDRETIAPWLAELVKFGYLRQTGDDSYRLVRGTGKRAPSIAAGLDISFDHNTGQFHQPVRESK